MSAFFVLGRVICIIFVSQLIINIMRFICIKPIADEQNIICMVNDVVVFNEQDEDGRGVQVEGQKGWCKGYELSFNNIKFVTHFTYLEG